MLCLKVRIQSDEPEWPAIVLKSRENDLADDMAAFQRRMRLLQVGSIDHAEVFAHYRPKAFRVHQLAHFSQHTVVHNAIVHVKDNPSRQGLPHECDTLEEEVLKGKVLRDGRDRTDLALGFDHFGDRGEMWRKIRKDQD
ncbi:unnamed protein product, partial [Aphanomyces euteiches]